MKKILAPLIYGISLAFFCCAAAPQQPQSSAPIYKANARTVNGVAPGYAPSGAGMNTVTLGPGTAFCAGSAISYSGGTLSVTLSATNYVYLDTSAACAPAINTTGFVAANIPIATVTAGSSVISAIIDDRTMFVQPGTPGGVTSIIPGTGVTCTSDVGGSCTGAVTINASGLNAKADIDSPTFTGAPQAPTHSTCAADTRIATGAYVSACAAGGSSSGAVDSVTGPGGYAQTGAVTLPLLDPTRIDYAICDSRCLVAGDWQFSGNPVGPITAINISGGIMTVTQANNQVAGNIGVWYGFSSPHSALNGTLFTVSATGLSSSQWEVVLNQTMLIPTMTSDTTPSGVVSSSSQYTGGGPAYDWHAFYPSTGNGWLTDGFSTGWLQYQFPTNALANSYYITPWSTDNFPSRSPTAWTLEASNTGAFSGEQTILDTESVSSGSWISNTPTNFPIGTPGSYVYYRLNITANGGNSYMGIKSLQLIYSATPDGSPSVTGVGAVGRHTLPTEIAYTPLYQTSHVPVVNMAQPSYTAGQAITDFSTLYAPISEDVVHHPVNFILSFNQDALSCETPSTIEGYFTTLWGLMWAHGNTVTQLTMTPSTSAYCWPDVIVAQVNQWLNGPDGVGVLNAHHSLLVDINGGCINDSNDPNCYFTVGEDAGHPRNPYTMYGANAVAQAESTGTNFLEQGQPSEGIVASVPGGVTQKMIDPGTGEDGVFGFISSAWPSNGAPATSDWYIGKQSPVSPLGTIGGLTLHYPGWNAGLQAAEIPQYSCWALTTGAIQNAPIAQACLDYLGDGYWSLDGTTRLDHAGNWKFNNLKLYGSFNGSTALGDTWYGGAGGVPAKLAGNTSDVVECQLQQGTGTVSAAPYWGPCSGGTAAFTLTTLGSSGPASYTSGVLNIPQYSGGGGGGGLFSGNLTQPNKGGMGLTTPFGTSTGAYLYADVANGVQLYDVSNNSTSNIFMEGQVKAYPSAAFTVTALFSIPPMLPSYGGLGFIAMDTVTGNLECFCLSQQAGNYSVQVFNATGPTSYSGFSGRQTLNQSALFWMRYQDDGTTVTTSVSSDGVNWQPFSSHTKASSFLGASGFNFFGISIDEQTSGAPYNIGTTIMSWTQTTP